jgi:aryl-alcohol dehydrogenase-like predicted oxidoreductase
MRYEPAPLEMRALGGSGLRVSCIGLGLAAVGRPGYINLGHGDDLGHQYAAGAMRRRAWMLLDAAWLAGVRYFDAARSYGRAEEFLAAWLNERAAEGCVVGSKWGYTYTAGWAVNADVHEVKDHSLATLERQLGESVALLGSRLRLYQIHSATLVSGVLERVNVLDRLARLKDADPPLRVGLTLSGPDSGEVLERALRIERSGQHLFDSVQATFNILEPSLAPLLSAAHADGMGVIVKEALANGRLTGRNREPDFAAKREVLCGTADRMGCTLDQLALAFVLDQPWADCVLSGATTLDQLRSNLGAAALTLDETARRSLRDLAEPPDRYWATRSALAWN